jgi:inner membrane protein
VHLQTHALASWLLAESIPALSRRDRFLVVLAGLTPDLDALTILGGTEAYFRWHHLLLHNLPAALATGLVCVALARARWPVALLALAAFHLHLFLDLLGSGGRDGFNWPIPYFAPFSLREFRWGGQWPLGSWQNVVITAMLVGLNVALGTRRGRTIVEMFSPRADAVVVGIFRRRFRV